MTMFFSTATGTKKPDPDQVVFVLWWALRHQKVGSSPMAVFKRRERNTVGATKHARVIDRFLLVCQITKVSDA